MKKIMDNELLHTEISFCTALAIQNMNTFIRYFLSTKLIMSINWLTVHNQQNREAIPKLRMT